MPDNAPSSFVRKTNRAGLFSTPTTTYLLTGEHGQTLGELFISYNKASYSPADGREGFRLRRNFWGTKWMYEGDDDRLFAKVSIGFKHTVSFGDGSRYRMKVRRKWHLFKPKHADDHTHLAIFFRDETEVMRLENRQALPLFGSEITAPMSGPISTDLNDPVLICGMLLLFQSYLLASRQTAGAT